LNRVRANVEKTLFACAVTGLLAGAAILTQPTAADASPSGCREVAKAKFLHDPKARREFKRYYKSQWKAYKTAHNVR
jgi:hypothetical protein